MSHGMENAANIKRYTEAMHGMQTGVKHELEYDESSGTPKHLRVGVNAAMVDAVDRRWDGCRKGEVRADLDGPHRNEGDPLMSDHELSDQDLLKFQTSNSIAEHARAAAGYITVMREVQESHDRKFQFDLWVASISRLADLATEYERAGRRNQSARPALAVLQRDLRKMLSDLRDAMDVFDATVAKLDL